MSRETLYPEDKYLLIGKVVKPQGLRGELKILCYSGQPENVQNYSELVLMNRQGQLSTPLKIAKSRVQGKSVIVAFEGISNRHQAEEAIEAEVLLAKDALPPATDDEYYWHQYLGKQLISEDGAEIGTVSQLFNNGAQDILVVSTGSEEVLVPVTKNIVVEERGNILVIAPPPGLLEINSEPKG